jgi:hypothetical protein
MLLLIFESELNLDRPLAQKDEIYCNREVEVLTCRLSGTYTQRKAPHFPCSTDEA